MRVDPAGPEDWTAWRALRLEALADTPIGFVETVEQALAKDEAAWRRRMAEVPLSLLARDAGRPVAMASGFVETVEQALAKDEAAWRRRMAEVPLSLLARDVGRPVAMASGFVIDGLPFLGAVYLTPAARGQGLLARLVAPVAQWAGEQGSDRLLLEVHEDNGRAQAAYARLGFVATGERRPYPLGPDRDELVMALPLP